RPHPPAPRTAAEGPRPVAAGGSRAGFLFGGSRKSGARESATRRAPGAGRPSRRSSPPCWGGKTRAGGLSGARPRARVARGVEGARGADGHAEESLARGRPATADARFEPRHLDSRPIILE